jgi:hypothetical protein
MINLATPTIKEEKDIYPMISPQIRLHSNSFKQTNVFFTIVEEAFPRADMLALGHLAPRTHLDVAPTSQLLNNFHQPLASFAAHNGSPISCYLQ